MKFRYIVYAAFLLGLLIGFFPRVQAATTWLVIPAGYRMDGYWYPTETIKFRDWGPYNGQTLCTLASRSLHKDEHGPHFSLCTTVQPGREWYY